MITPSLADPWNAPGAGEALLRALGREDAPLLLRPHALPSLGWWGIRFLRNTSRRRFERAFLESARFARYSQGLMDELLARNPLEFDHARRGILKIYSDAASLDRGRQVASWLKQVGLEHRLLDNAGLLHLEPALADVIDGLAGAIHYPGDEVGDARAFCEGLQEVAERAGVTFRFSDQVLGAERQGRAIVSLKTPRGRLEVDRVVLAAGSWSWPLGRLLGVKVPVRPAKGYSLTVPIPKGAPRPRHAVVDEDLHAAVVPLGDRALRVAGTAEFAGFDPALTAGRVDNLIALLRRVYPRIEVARGRARPWCGFRPMTPDGLPLIGPTRIDNLYLDTGHGPLGWTLACASGKLLADLLLGREPDVDPSPFAPDRF
jgi:D-amino-acid dehydrogenase